jgi:hypothetical protein
MMLDDVVYDMLPMVCGDPFPELRSSVFTGARASDDALAATIGFYQQAFSALSPRDPFVAADHVDDLREL